MDAVVTTLYDRRVTARIGRTIFEKRRDARCLMNYRCYNLFNPEERRDFCPRNVKILLKKIAKLNFTTFLQIMYQDRCHIDYNIYQEAGYDYLAFASGGFKFHYNFKELKQIYTNQLIAQELKLIEKRNTKCPIEIFDHIRSYLGDGGIENKPLLDKDTANMVYNRDMMAAEDLISRKEQTLYNIVQKNGVAGKTYEENKVILSNPKNFNEKKVKVAELKYYLKELNLSYTAKNKKEYIKRLSDFINFITNPTQIKPIATHNLAHKGTVSNMLFYHGKYSEEERRKNLVQTSKMLFNNRYF